MVPPHRPPLEPGTAFPRLERVAVADAVRSPIVLSPRQRDATMAIAGTLFTTPTGPPEEERLTWLTDEVSDFLSHAGARARLIYRSCLFAISVIAPLLIGRIGPFRKLSIERRMEALERLERSPLGIVVFGCKMLLCILYYEHPDAAREIGFDGRCMGDDLVAASALPRPASRSSNGEP